MKIISAAAIGLFTFYSWSQSHVAIVKSVRGEVQSLNGIEEKSLKENDLVSLGSTLKTNEGSFLVLVFQDNSRIGLAPSTEIKVSSFSDKSPGVIDLSKGRIRALVSGDKNTSAKLFVKTPSSVLSVNEGEFLSSFSNLHSSTIVFDGEVYLNNYPKVEEESEIDLEKISKEGILLKSGEFSVVPDADKKPNPPVLLNILQKEQLEKNKEFVVDSSPFSSGMMEYKSVVPYGLSGKLVSNNFEILSSELSNVGVAAKSKNISDNEAIIKPLSGSYLQIETGKIIPPGHSAVPDINSGTFVLGVETGAVAIDGSYIPPENPKETVDSEAQLQKYKRYKAKSFSYDLDTRFPAHGGIRDVNDPQRTQTDFSGTTIRLRDH